MSCAKQATGISKTSAFYNEFYVFHIAEKRPNSNDMQQVMKIEERS